MAVSSELNLIKPDFLGRLEFVFRMKSNRT